MHIEFGLLQIEARQISEWLSEEADLFPKNHGSHGPMPLPDNPYEPSQVLNYPSPHRATKSGLARIGWGLVYAYPLALLASFYGTWMLAGWELGYPPRPSLDDPKSIGGMVPFLLSIPALLIVSLPVAAPLGLIAAAFLSPFSKGAPRLAGSVLLALLYLAMLLGVILLLRADPGRVVEWYFD